MVYLQAILYSFISLRRVLPARVIFLYWLRYFSGQSVLHLVIFCTHKKNEQFLNRNYSMITSKIIMNILKCLKVSLKLFQMSFFISALLIVFLLNHMFTNGNVFENLFRKICNIFSFL